MRGDVDADRNIAQFRAEPPDALAQDQSALDLFLEVHGNNDQKRLLSVVGAVPLFCRRLRNHRAQNNEHGSQDDTGCSHSFSPLVSGSYVRAGKRFWQTADNPGQRRCRHHNATMRNVAPVIASTILSFLLVGVASSADGKRDTAAVVLFALAFVAVLMIMVDLDRPQEGLLKVSQAAMSDVLRQMTPFGQ